MIFPDERRRRATSQWPRTGSADAEPAAEAFPGGAAASIAEVGGEHL
jgi:hypothetical protein